MRERIIISAREIFFRQGFKKTTVDDIAKAAGISKKTIYNHFQNKRELLKSVIQSNMEYIVSTMETIAYDFSLPIMSKVEALTEFGAKELIQREQIFLDDIIINEPDIGKNFTPVVYSKLVEITRDLLKEAGDSGLLRENVKVEILPYVYVNLLDGFISLFRQQNLQFFSIPVDPGELFREMVKMSFYGILKEKKEEEDTSYGKE